LAGGARWATASGRFRLETVVVKGTREAAIPEIQALVEEWMGRNILTIDLMAVERKVREHPWIGSPGWVRIQRRLPSSVLITLKEREAGGLALLDGAVWLLDTAGLPIDRYGPRYAHHDFPLVKGLEGFSRSRPEEAVRLKDALGRAVRVARELKARDAVFYEQVSEIDVAQPHEVVLRLDDEEYDLRLSAEEPLRNLENYLVLRDRIAGSDSGAIEYVDLRWQDRVAVMPAADGPQRNGGE
ncbi:MAG TPA: FtsQ-type POTRA domain-containing protein, partial [Candidatus Polarisedimenticolia bacterium]|nr:FtsQ-type POTRA domain-containing protein [Candidatus Polarisedimenticolia bacterium]